MNEEPKPTPRPGELRGLQKICREAGRMRADYVWWVWDYHQETAVRQDSQTKEERLRSNRAKRIKTI